MFGILDLLAKEPMQYLMIIFWCFLSVCSHEYMHAQMALWQGDPTAARAGHLTLNPLKQMGVFSIVMCCMIGIAFGAVPVNPSLMKKRYSEALVAFAGPMTNLIIFLIASILATVSINSNIMVFHFFRYGAALNIVLFILNMLPFPILDGATVWGYLLPMPAGIKRMNSEVKNGIMVFLFFGIIFCSGILWGIGYFLTHSLIKLIAGIFY